MDEARTHSGKRGKMRTRTTKPKTAPVTTLWIHPAAIQEARNLAEGRDVHVDYDTEQGCMWVRNGAR